MGVITFVLAKLLYNKCDIPTSQEVFIKTSHTSKWVVLRIKKKSRYKDWPLFWFNYKKEKHIITILWSQTTKNNPFGWIDDVYLSYKTEMW